MLRVSLQWSLFVTPVTFKQTAGKGEREREDRNKSTLRIFQEEGTREKGTEFSCIVLITKGKIQAAPIIISIFLIFNLGLAFLVFAYDTVVRPCIGFVAPSYLSSPPSATTTSRSAGGKDVSSKGGSGGDGGAAGRKMNGGDVRARANGSTAMGRNAPK